MHSMWRGGVSEERREQRQAAVWLQDLRLLTQHQSEDVLQENIEREVMNALSEVIDYDRSEGVKPEE